MTLLYDFCSFRTIGLGVTFGGCLEQCVYKHKCHWDASPIMPYYFPTYVVNEYVFASLKNLMSSDERLSYGLFLSFLHVLLRIPHKMRLHLILILHSV